MIFKRIELKLSDTETKALKASFGKAIASIESAGRLHKGSSLDISMLDELRTSLSSIVKKTPPLVSILEDISKSNNFYHINLYHLDTEILNIPWGIAIDPVSDRPLNQNPQLFISKNTLLAEPRPKPPTPGPLKILIMLSSPKDITIEGRLNYEEEERLILSAFEPLFTSGQVQVDFTDDGSLSSLKRKIDKNNYHILHFSGHGIFDEEKGEARLLLEDALSLKAEYAKPLEFAEAILKDDHTIPLVFLSSCQSAQAKFEKGMAGLTGTLLQKGITAVVSMGMSISDQYATLFAYHFYQKIADKKTLTLPEAFAYAQNEIRNAEANEIIRQGNWQRQPAQWIIPNLYLSCDTQIVDWDNKDFEPLVPDDTNIIFANTTMGKTGIEKDQFVGRREDLARIMPVLYEKKHVLLNGQGGIGKTTMARKLILRLIAFQPDLTPFIFNQEGTEFALSTVLDQLKRFCLRKDKIQWVDALVHLKDNLIEQINFLLDRIGREFKVVLLFDNVESFQDERTGEFLSDHEPTLSVMAYAAKHPKIFTIFTCRYPIKELEEALISFDLNDIELNDFIRKCYNLELKLDQNQMEFLYQAIGGNFRYIEFFHKAFSKADKEMDKTLEEFEEKDREVTKEVLQKMAENLIFDRLWEKTCPKEKELANLLYHFSLPVIETAFHLQGYPADALKAPLEHLKDLTLIQVYLDRELSLVYYFMPPLVKNLLKRIKVIEKMPAQFHENAGRYHYYMLSEVQHGNINELEAAFWQFYHARNKERMDEPGDRLAWFYYSRSFYENSLKVCQAVYELFGEDMPWWCGNRMGTIFLSTGQYDQALPFYDKALKAFDTLPTLTDEDKENKGATLNNISQICSARGDYDTALDYLNRSLKIFKEGGNKYEEGATLNNISSIYYARGDYDTALDYLNRSLKIRQEIGGKSGEGTTLSNMGSISYGRGDYDTALDYLNRSLKIRQEIGDKSGEGTTLANIGNIFYARGDYDTALDYLNRSLKIRQEIGDKSGEGTTLNNICAIYHARGDYDTALDYLHRSLKISQEIGDKSGQIPTLHNIAMIEAERENMEAVLELEMEAYRLAVETNDAMGLFQVGQVFGQLLVGIGQREEGTAILQRAFEIGQAAGLPGTEQIRDILAQPGV
ncbi:MAG: tetratricopeptide repeat protein [bacterium]